MEWAEIFADTKEFEKAGFKATIKKWTEAASRAIILWGTGMRRVEEHDGWSRYEANVEALHEQAVLSLLHGLDSWNLPDAITRESVQKFLTKAKPALVHELILSVNDFNRVDDEKKTT